MGEFWPKRISVTTVLSYSNQWRVYIKVSWWLYVDHQTCVLEVPAWNLPCAASFAGHQVLVAPPPHAGVALITALNVLEGFNITSQVPRNITYHWTAEVLGHFVADVQGIASSMKIPFSKLCFLIQALKIALAMASGLGDSMFDSSISEVVAEMTRYITSWSYDVHRRSYWGIHVFCFSGQII